MKKVKKKVIIEWTTAVLLLFFVVTESPYINYYLLSPNAAHEQSERTFYYGPTEVVEEIDLGDVHIFLGKYKDWFSANMVVKHAGVFWGPGSGVGGNEIKKNKDISYSWSGSSINEDLMLMKFYGIVTNPKIDLVELDVVEGYNHREKPKDGELHTFSYLLKEHRMFLFHWNEQEHEYQWLSIRGLDENREVVYEETFY
jgi:hypothetical protein